MKIVCIGDSLTFGYGVSRYENWLHLINNRNTMEAINKGINGDTTAGMIFRFYEDVVLNNPEYAFIMGGTNDFLMNCSVNYVKENIRELITEAKKEKMKVILGIQPPIISHLANAYWQSGDNYDEINLKLNEYRNWVVDFANSNKIMYIDFYKEFTHYLNKVNEEVLYIDGIHPTPKGQEIMADLFIKTLLFEI
ncbi:GDSL-type esterase/lipase family protein [Clostridium sp. ZS2-4]|uniref:GDSL-type esterase/lipase family protein n=1 Tax=Clostridium sp. ZS2-4 TaxID=2987703 RepID=UPI00227A0F91|nr:GDSL-type esterase/lipase family protein [Clostridium sp. ZS2-4]MCY6356077.1 GDSL-type esterase/lipase family protein [Clostridium sp. ZS2-4]